MNKEKQFIDILMKYFNIKIEYAFNEYEMLHIQAWSDLDTYDTSAYEVIKNQQEIDFIKDFLNNYF